MRDVAEVFANDIREHELSVYRDDGLYRHLRFRRPNTSMYWFDIVTWPGYLAFVGDCGDFVFTRCRDMFEFFVDKSSTGSRGEINPGYWAEKLVAPRGRQSAREFSEVKFERHVREWMHEQFESLAVDIWDEHATPDTWSSEFGVGCDGWGGELRWFIGPNPGLTWPIPDPRLALREAINEHFFDRWDPVVTDEQAHARLADFTFRDLQMYDTWEWDLRDFEWQFLWCCHAIVWAIEQYHAQTRELVVAHA